MFLFINGEYGNGMYQDNQSGVKYYYFGQYPGMQRLHVGEYDDGKKVASVSINAIMHQNVVCDMDIRFSLRRISLSAFLRSPPGPCPWDVAHERGYTVHLVRGMALHMPDSLAVHAVLAHGPLESRFLEAVGMRLPVLLEKLADCHALA